MWLALWAAIGLLLAWAASYVSWREVFEALLRADLPWVALAIVANLCGLPLWTLAVRLFIPPGEPRPFRGVMAVLALTSTAIQCFSIFAGGATAAFLFVRRLGLSTGAMISVLTLEQVTSGIVKSLIVGIAVLSAAAPFALKAAGGALLVTIACAFAALVGAAHCGPKLAAVAKRISGRLGRILAAFAEWTSHLDTLRRPWRYFAAVALTFCRRMAEMLAIVCIQKASGLPVSVELALLVLAAISMATIIPGPPGNVGMYEAAVVVAYSWGGVGAETAVATALLQHFAFLAAAATPGFVVLLAGRLRLRI